MSVEVETSEGEWVALYNAIIQEVIEDGVDVYVRGSGRGDGGGFAYASRYYNVFGEDCETPPSSGYFGMVEW